MKTRNFASAVLSVLAFGGMGASAAFALPLGDGQFNAALRQTSPAAQHFAANEVDFTAIVALDDCSGSLVRFTTSEASDMALVLSNGHCLSADEFLRPGEVVVNRDSARRFRLLNSDASRTLATLRATKVLYATMTDTDVTLYRLGVTFADIKSRYGVDALTISAQRPDVGTPVRIVSGFWRKIYSCNVDSFIFEMKEGAWTFTDSIKYTQPGCEIADGTSGSPIVNAETREVVGINNTTNEDGERCTVNNPCEVDANGNVSVHEGASYGQELFHFYGCLNDANDIDLNIAGCELPKPATLH